MTANDFFRWDWGRYRPYPSPKVHSPQVQCFLMFRCANLSEIARAFRTFCYAGGINLTQQPVHACLCPIFPGKLSQQTTWDLILFSKQNLNQARLSLMSPKNPILTKPLQFCHLLRFCHSLDKATLFSKLIQKNYLFVLKIKQRWFLPNMAPVYIVNTSKVTSCKKTKWPQFWPTLYRLQKDQQKLI